MSGLFSLGCTYGASAFACAAIKALVFIDYVLSVFFGNSTNRAFFGTCTASDAFFSVNFVSHYKHLRYFFTIISHRFEKINVYLQYFKSFYSPL